MGDHFAGSVVDSGRTSLSNLCMGRPGTRPFLRFGDHHGLTILQDALPI